MFRPMFIRWRQLLLLPLVLNLVQETYVLQQPTWGRSSACDEVSFEATSSLHEATSSLPGKPFVSQ